MKKKKHFPVLVEQDVDGVFIVDCPVFQGCHSYGKTLDEALENIREAIQVCIEEEGETESDSIFLGVRDIELTI